jgi:transcriptional regulator with XRE-family HTH domain
MCQEELAKRLGESRPMIARYELGETPIPKAVEMAFKVIEEEEKR